MVQTKSTPRHAEVRPLKCIVYISRNPVTFAIYRRREFYLLDQQARETKTPRTIQAACPHAAHVNWNYHYDHGPYSSQMLQDFSCLPSVGTVFVKI